MLDRWRVPIVQAPMAGGISTPALVAAVSRAGGLGFLASGMLTPDALREQLAAVRAELGDAPFGVNLFMPSPAPGDSAAIAAYASTLAPIASRLGVALGEPTFATDAYDEKLALLLGDAPAVVSFAFGCPSRAVVAQLHDAGAQVWVTVTQVDEAERAAAVGADAVVAQGNEAGGHRGAFVDDDRPQLPVLELVAAIRRATPSIPVVAAGAIMTGRHVAEVLQQGAAAAQAGTAFMLTPEAGTDATHRAAIAGEGPTTITRAFTGRRARGIANAWTELVGDAAPSAYPQLMHLTAPLRTRARQLGDADGINLWAGERHAQARAVPASDVVQSLAAGV
ncbi:MAG: nitronate monooxygenase [Solirubrobacteraceae bacterium]|nr:nitronate monooxygenase [Solirubrobacteraceae bacterium]